MTALSLIAPYLGKHLPTDYEMRCISNAAKFRLVRGGFRAEQQDRHEAATLEDAVAFAKANRASRKWMIYAVTADGRDAHIVNI